jgi:ABC-type amino acid transport substrate-binding protein
VLKEHGVGSPTLAQPYLNSFVANAAKQNEWSDAKGQYYVTRGAAEEFIASQKPHYGIMSLAAFLDFRIKYGLEVVGKVSVSLVGGQQYFVISKSATDLAGCKGKKLASDHATDVRFIERVVARGAFTLKDFQLVPTQRPLQTIKEVIAGNADCALIDDAQMAELTKLPGSNEVKTAWKSEKLPPMVVTAFPSAPTAERQRFQQNFNKVCNGDTKPACAEVGISSLDMASAADYAAVVAAYGN